VRALALWRVTHGHLFGESQLVLHTGKDLNVCREVHAPGRLWARERGWGIRETNGQEEIANPADGSRWIVRGNQSVYGYPASMAIADESWAMPARLVDDGIEPTLMERQSPQLVLLSTAHSRATSLMLGRRAAALETWEKPGRHVAIGMVRAGRHAARGSVRVASGVPVLVPGPGAVARGALSASRGRRT
jgi:hypothetical protein